MREEVWEEPAAGGPDSGWAGDRGGRRLLQQVPLFRLGVQYSLWGKQGVTGETTLFCLVKLESFGAQSNPISACTKDALGVVRLLDCGGQQAAPQGTRLPSKRG